MSPIVDLLIDFASLGHILLAIPYLVVLDNSPVVVPYCWLPLLDCLPRDLTPGVEHVTILIAHLLALGSVFPDCLHILDYLVAWTAEPDDGYGLIPKGLFPCALLRVQLGPKSICLFRVVSVLIGW